jgi:dihydroneopterin aldolase
MTAQIEIKDLLLHSHIGGTEEERHDRQDVLINLVLEVDTYAAGGRNLMGEMPPL